MNGMRHRALMSSFGVLALALSARPEGEPEDTTPPEHLKTTPLPEVLPEVKEPPMLEMFVAPVYDYCIPEPPKRKQRHEGDQSWKTSFPDVVRGHAPKGKGASRVGAKRR